MIWFLNKRVVLLSPKFGALQFGEYMKSGNFRTVFFFYFILWRKFDMNKNMLLGVISPLSFSYHALTKIGLRFFAKNRHKETLKELSSTCPFERRGGFHGNWECEILHRLERGTKGVETSH